MSTNIDNSVSTVPVTVDDGMTTFHNGIFGDVRVVDHRNAPWFIAKDICDAIDISNSRQAISRLDDDEKDVISNDTPGGIQEVSIVNEPGMYSLVLSSRKKEARDFKRWITHDILPAIRATGKYEVKDSVPALMPVITDMQKAIEENTKRVTSIEEMLTSAGILRPFVAPRYTFENLTTRYKQATGRDRVRDFYDDIGDYFGIKVPYSDKIHITVRDWILQRIPLETIQEMVVGFETHLLTRSDEGHLVSLNGCFGNTVEWDKVLREFDHKCAYCGDDKATLIAEHIVPQSIMSKEHPELTDSIFNIVPTCSSCNKSKNTHHFPSWYKKQPFYSDERYWKILKHISKYHIGNTESIV